VPSRPCWWRRDSPKSSDRTDHFPIGSDTKPIIRSDTTQREDTGEEQN